MEFTDVAVNAAIASGVLQASEAADNAVLTYGSGSSALPDSESLKGLFAFTGFTGDAFQARHPLMDFTSPTNPVIYSENTGAGTMFAGASVVWFRSKWVDESNNVSVGYIFDSDTTGDDGASAESDKMVVTYLGITTDNLSADVDRFYSTVELINSNTDVEYKREAAAATLVNVSHAVTLFR
jgi:hypothetical protein